MINFTSTNFVLLLVVFTVLAAIMWKFCYYL